MSKIPSMEGSPWHVEFLRINDERRHKGRCVFNDSKSKICIHTKSLDYSAQCRGSSHCAYYDENPNAYQSQFNGMLNGNVIKENSQINAKLNDKKMTKDNSLVKNHLKPKKHHKKIKMKKSVKINNITVNIGGKFTHRVLGSVTLKKIYGDVMLVAIETGEIKRLSYIQCTRLGLIKEKSKKWLIKYFK